MNVSYLKVVIIKPWARASSFFLLRSPTQDFRGETVMIILHRVARQLMKKTWAFISVLLVPVF